MGTEGLLLCLVKCVVRALGGTHCSTKVARSRGGDRICSGRSSSPLQTSRWAAGRNNSAPIKINQGPGRRKMCQYDQKSALTYVDLGISRGRRGMGMMSASADKRLHC